MPESEQSFDAIVIGGGSAGLSFAKTAAGFGASVALIERGPVGGTCVNRGCVPKKLMWQAAHWLRKGRDMEAVGLTTLPPFDFTALHGRIGSKVDIIRQSHARSLEEAGVTLIRDTATIEAAGRVTVGATALHTDRLIIATGARPALLEIEGAALTETSDDVFGWTEIPERLLILGGGYIGCEFAAIFSAFGTSVTLIDPSDRLLSPFSGALAEAAKDSLERAGVQVIFGAKPVGVREMADGLIVSTDAAGEIGTDRVLNATGRTPNVDRLGALCQDLEVADSGALAVDGALATNVGGVHAIGDAADRLPLTPVATRDGRDLARKLFGDSCTLVELDRVARAAFLIPPVAEVGEPGDAPADHGADLSDGVTGPEGANTTLTLLAASDGRTTGLALAGDHAAELVSVSAALVGTDRDLLVRAEGIHPTFAEELTGN